MSAPFRSHRELDVYKNAIEAATEMLFLTVRLPADERDARNQALRSARSVAANIAEAWRKRRYRAAFISKLSDSDAEAAEVQVWLDVFVRAGYITQPEYDRMDDVYDKILSQLVLMMANPDKWTGQKQQTSRRKM
jgi:four helix bundle protein